MRTLLFFIIIFFQNNLLSDDINFDNRVKSFILDNPEIIIESLQKFEILKQKAEEQELKKVISDNLDLIENSKGFLYDGNKFSTNKIIEFFDYNCGYCKKSHKELTEMVLENNDIKVIYVNLPVLSERSVELSKLSLVIGNKNNDKFKKFHNFLLSSKKSPDDKDIMKFIQKIGLNYEELINEAKKDEIQKEIDQNIDLANKLKIRGTPAFLINGELVSGFVGKKIIKSLLFNNQQ